MHYDDHELGNRRQGILSLIVAEPRVKHEGQGFSGREKNATNTNITFVKENDIVELSYPSDENETTNEGGNTPLLHLSSSRL